MSYKVGLLGGAFATPLAPQIRLVFVFPLIARDPHVHNQDFAQRMSTGGAYFKATRGSSTHSATASATRSSTGNHVADLGCQLAGYSAAKRTETKSQKPRRKAIYYYYVVNHALWVRLWKPERRTAQFCVCGLQKKQAQRACLRLAFANHKKYDAVLVPRVDFFCCRSLPRRTTWFPCWCIALDEIALHRMGNKVGRETHSSGDKNHGRSYRLHVG